MGRLAQLLIAVTLATIGTVAAPAVAAPALWEVRDGDSSIWLFGSIRNLPVDLKWRTQLFDAVLADADQVVFEADTSDLAVATTGAAALARGVYTDGTLLTDRLDPDTERDLREAADMAGLPHGMLIAMRPWFAAMAIYVGSEVAYGFEDQPLADQLQAQLPADRLLFLVTVEDRLTFIDEMPEHEQLSMLVSIVEQVDSIPKTVVKLRSNWLTGTPENVAHAFLMDSVGFSKASVENILRPYARNWLPKIEAMLLHNDENLIIVETAHLVGQGSLLNVLSDAGYTIERVQ